jgi:hypothetical protein
VLATSWFCGVVLWSSFLPAVVARGRSRVTLHSTCRACLVLEFCEN